MSVKLDEFPELPFQDIKEKPKCHGQMDGRKEGWTDGQCENSIPPINIVCWGGGGRGFRTLFSKKNQNGCPTHNPYHSVVAILT